ncbi:MAG: hypothetical protein IPK82_38030 [Polyangiaceae bacterium]|nr:hypothetical protein [Polyangiaceae bacterium]
MRSSTFAPSKVLLPRFRRSLKGLVIAAIPMLAAACTVPDPSNSPADSAVDARVREVSFQHDDCKADGSSKTVDVNSDTRPDIVHVMKDGKEACRMVDLNFDGLTDVFIYYDEKGQERRREADFDRDGRPDQVSIFQNGQLIENQRETNFDDKIDTWDYYQGGVLSKRERDSDGDAIIDQWWTFYDPARPKCATVASDRNADGKPDADSQVDLCGTGYVTPGTVPGAAPGAPSAAASGSAAPVATPVPTSPVVAGPGAPTPGPSTSSQPAPAPTSSAPAPQ